VSDSIPQQPITTLWRLTCDASEVACVIYRVASGMELRLESPHATILREPFELQPRMVARTNALRSSLLRRGWHEPQPRSPVNP
jgi:hypothetical protein